MICCHEETSRLKKNTLFHSYRVLIFFLLLIVRFNQNLKAFIAMPVGTEKESLFKTGSD